MTELSQKALQALDFSEMCLLQGLCTPKEYMRAVKTIWKDDLKMQKQFMLDKRAESEEVYGEI